MYHHKRGCPLFTHPSRRGPGHPTVCTCGPRLKPDGQPARLLRWLRANPGASSLEVTQALYIVNVTGRISDLRSAGYVVDCKRRPDGADGYFVRDATPGVAHIDADDSKAQVERKMAEAFAPLTAMREAWVRVFGDDADV